MKTEKTSVCLWDVASKPWLCPVCGLSRGNANHRKCSKITQQKHQEERAAKGKTE